MPPAPSRRSPLRPLPLPDPGPAQARDWVAHHLADLVAEDRADIAPSPRFRGGQMAAERALGSLDVAGYAETRNEAYPVARRGASGLSPYIRHGLLSLPRVWDRALDRSGGRPTDGLAVDARRFCDELLWQEYARHWYARLGRATTRPVRHHVEPAAGSPPAGAVGLAGDSGFDEDMACIELTLGELEDDGWLVNQARMWLASHWSIRLGRPLAEGEDFFFRHLLDGSRAANRLGWQWVTGAGSGRAYGFSRWQVERRAAGLCATCELGARCPIDRWPAEPSLIPVDLDPRLATDPTPAITAGPSPDQRIGPLMEGLDMASTGKPGGGGEGPVDEADRPRPDGVWLTAESLGHGQWGDPASVARPDLPLVFVFDRPLLARLRLSAKRLIFLTETLAELATVRAVEVHLGDPVEVLAGRSLATTFAPVPGWRRRAARIRPVEVHPWRWLRRPGSGPISSYEAWLDGLSPEVPPWPRPGGSEE